MRILYIADGRSPITLSWISYFIENGHQVHLVSSYPAQPKLELASLNFLPVAFSGTAGQDRSEGRGKVLKSVFTVGVRTHIRHFFGPLTIPAAAKKLKAIINEIKPELVHALRIPYEGMLAAAADLTSPLLVSIWGNDFTLHANTTPLMSTYTWRTLVRADALLTDCQRDANLARRWGYSSSRPCEVLPGAGGVQLDLFTQPAQERDAPVVINPRGLRAYVRNDTFFKALPLVLQDVPDARFLCPAMAGETEAERWVSELKLAAQVELLPKMDRLQMAELFQRAQVVVSPSEHDGTPNTLLEAMACGCFPVVGDIESLREWVKPGLNGLLVDPSDPAGLASAIISALKYSELRDEAAEFNRALVEEKADYRKVMPQAETYYREIVGKE